MVLHWSLIAFTRSPAVAVITTDGIFACFTRRVCQRQPLRSGNSRKRQSALVLDFPVNTSGSSQMKLEILSFVSLANSLVLLSRTRFVQRLPVCGHIVGVL